MKLKVYHYRLQPQIPIILGGCGGGLDDMIMLNTTSKPYMSNRSIGFNTEWP